MNLSAGQLASRVGASASLDGDHLGTGADIEVNCLGVQVRDRLRESAADRQVDHFGIPDSRAGVAVVGSGCRSSVRRAESSSPLLDD